MYDQILLITHGAALFPLGVFVWNWKMRKDVPSAFMFIKFLYGVTFSLLYHSHHALPKVKYLLLITILIIGHY